MIQLDARNNALLLSVQTVTYIESLGIFFGTAVGTLQSANLGVASKDGSNWEIVLDTQKLRLPGVALQNIASNGTGVFALSCNPQFFACYLLYSADAYNNWKVLSNPLIPNGFFAGPTGMIGVDISQFFFSPDGIRFYFRTKIDCIFRWRKMSNVNSAQCTAYNYEFVLVQDTVVAIGQNCILYADVNNLAGEWTVAVVNATTGVAYKDDLVFTRFDILCFCDCFFLVSLITPSMSP